MIHPHRDSNLIKSLDFYHYWRPFTGKVHSSQLSLHSVIKSLAKTRGELRRFSANSAKHQIATFENEILIVYDTINQREAVKPFIQAMADKVTVVSHLPKDNTHTFEPKFYESLSVGYHFKMLLSYFTFYGDDRHTYRNRFYKYYEMLGVYEYFRRCFIQSPKLRFVIACNDHSGISLAAFAAANRLHGRSIASIYIQHASVSDKFPPLRVNYALLDGQDAADKYEKAGPSTAKVILVGAMKYDAYLNNPAINVLGKYIGICVGHLHHDIEVIHNLGSLLVSKGFNICIRFHPAVKSEIRKKFIVEGWPISFPETENALDFILRCNTVVAGDSNILLEAILMKRRPVYFDSVKKNQDYYGFLENGVVDRCYQSGTKVIEALDRSFDMNHHRQKASYYQHTLYTKYEGRSTELVAQTIEKLMKV